MKEFIEKLIGRLEEKDDDCGCGKIDVWEAISIVNQLAEEYNQEHDDTDYANIELYAFWKKHQWIPCSERLPEENQMVITCDKDGWVSVHVNLLYKGKKNDFQCGYYVAWMPLPEPYIPKQG